MPSAASTARWARARASPAPPPASSANGSKAVPELTQGGQQERPEGARGAREDPGLIALLANPDSGTGEAEDVADAMRALGADVAVFGLDDVDAAVAAEPDPPGGRRAATARWRTWRRPRHRAGIPARGHPDGHRERLRARGGDPARHRRGRPDRRRGVAEARRFDLGPMDERPFLNVASLGLSPAAAEHASGLKEALGPLAYTAGALRAGPPSRPGGMHGPLRRRGALRRRGLAGDRRVHRRLRRRVVRRGRPRRRPPRRRGNRGRFPRAPCSATPTGFAPGTSRTSAASTAGAAPTAEIELARARSRSTSTARWSQSGTCGFERRAGAVAVVVG